MTRNHSDKKEQKNGVKQIGFFSLLRYSSTGDKVLISVASLLAMATGAAVPALTIIFGVIVDKFIHYDMTLKNVTTEHMGNITTEEFLTATGDLCLWYTVIGVVFMVCNYIMVTFFSLAASNQIFRIRCNFMSCILKQEIGWYDTNENSDFASRFTGDLALIQNGIGEKFGICIKFMTTIIICVGCGLYYGWKLTLVTLSSTPVLTIVMTIMFKLQSSASQEESDAYEKAGAVAEEVFSSIRTVFAFGGESKEIARYGNCLEPARKKALKRGMMTAIGSGISWFCVFSGYALSFWYGAKLFLEEMDQKHPQYTGGTLIIVFFNVMIASSIIGQSSPYFEAFALARGAGSKIFNVIDRVPSIDSSSEEGKRPDGIVGHINITDVYFSYPSRPSVSILRGVSLEVKSGETVALVGASGCGKSTIIQLILRLYDSNIGAITLDGYNLKDLNVGWLRDQIGLVGQEPVLFSTSIAENIRYGKQDATDEEIENASKIAHVYDFIQGLPQGYNTLVGERGTQLSGGQKQRIAIARALVKNPRLLLLDEATSALDTESESLVQTALDEARKGRTTLVVAHRLSTIKNANKIVVLSEGQVKEVGTHNELMERKGFYYELISAQTNALPDEDDDEDEDADVFLPNLPMRNLNMTKEFLHPSEAIRNRHTSDRSSRSRHPSSSRTIRRQISTPSSLHRHLSATSGETEMVEEEDIEEEISNNATSLSHKRLWKISYPEWPYTLVGAISSLFMGLHFPAYGIVFGNILGVLSLGDRDEISQEISTFSIVFVGMALSSGIFSFLQVYMFTVSGEHLSARLRKMVFSNIVKQDVEFFDDGKNSVGTLCSRLASDASSVQGMTGSRLSTLFQSGSTLIGCMVLALWMNWKIGLVVLAFVPLMLAGSFFEFLILSDQFKNETQGTESASKIAVEAIDNIRTVASLHQERVFYQKFYSALLDPHKKSRLRSHLRGIIYGSAEAIQSFAYVASLYYGSVLVSKGEITYEDLMKILEGVMLGIGAIGEAMAFSPDYNRARIAALRILKLLDLKPKINAFLSDGKTMQNFAGRIRFDDVYFNYPTRPNVRILKGLQFKIDPGTTAALVGSSGCGKSTCTQLIERFYDTVRGSVRVDDEDVKDVNLSVLRSHLGVVSQEPTLFGRSIAENIAYGDNERIAGMQEIIEAARQANIHGFITSLPQGYDTQVGDKGAQLSGGQKQRIAIARALLRNPKILILDEATSALDAESEKVVQDALDKARRGRTCLIIAHRLTTIQNAGVILVIHKGRVVEKGTHQELLTRKGYYYKLHNTQSVAE